MKITVLNQLWYNRPYRLTIEQDTATQLWRPIDYWQRIANRPGLDHSSTETFVSQTHQDQIVDWFRTHDYHAVQSTLRLQIYSNSDQLYQLAETFESAYQSEPRMLLEYSSAPSYLKPNQIIMSDEYASYTHQIVFERKPNDRTIDWILNHPSLIKTSPEFTYIRNPLAWTRWSGKHILVTYPYVVTALQLMDPGMIQTVNQIIICDLES